MTPNAYPLRIVSRDAFGAALTRSILGGEIVDAAALNAELVRGVLWGATRSGPVHINRLMNLVLGLTLAYTTGADEGATRARLRRTLDALAEAGDAVELDQGRWSPTTPRVVALGDTSEERLLLGGVPSSLLPDPLRGTVSHRGALRFVRGRELEIALALRVDPIDAWVGAPGLPLREWAGAILEAALPSYAEASEASDVQVYSPSVRRRRTQGGRWAEPSACADGRYLARRSRIPGWREHRIIDLRAGSIIASGNVLAPGEARRMMYAFDALAGRQIEAPLVPEGDGLRLTLWSEVPSAERRLFSLIGALTVPNDKYYPRSWHFHEKWAGEVRGRLEALEIRLSSQEREGSDEQPH